MTPTVTLHLGDCLTVMRGMPDASVDAIVTDPPAGIAFMGKEWDRFSGTRTGVSGSRKTGSGNECDSPGFARGVGCGPTIVQSQRNRDAFVGFLSERLAECLRIAKPGAVMLCWAIPRTSHWTGTAIEDAGWIIQDRLAHCFGSGFPKHKSHLKPAVEDWWLARKPGPKWLGVDACRVETSDERSRPPRTPNTIYGGGNGTSLDASDSNPAGRWPPNLLLSHVGGPDGCNGECVEGCPIRLMGGQSGEKGPTAPPGRPARSRATSGLRLSQFKGTTADPATYPDSGTAARYFPNFEPDPFLYCPKASRSERNAGCEGMPEVAQHRYADGDGFAGRTQDDDGNWVNTDHANRKASANHHPTVKPLKLCRWLCRLATPPGGTILDPFMGSGSTGRAAVQEGFSFIGVERDAEYHEIARRRIDDALNSMPLLTATSV